MAIQSLGDMSRHFQSLRQNTQIRGQLATLTQEMSTGLASDVTARLRGDGHRLTEIDRTISLLDSYSRSSAETAQTLQTMQTSLARVSDVRGDLAAQLSLVNIEGDSGASDAGQIAARSGFAAVVQILNGSSAGNSIFAGSATGTAALASPDEMMDDILASAVAAGAGTAAELSTVIDAWFDDPAGGFATLAYKGDTGDKVERRIDFDTSVMLAARADDPALRDVMKATALAALSGDSSLGLSQRETNLALRTSGTRLFTAAQPLTQLQARVGMAEATVEETSVRHAAQKTAFGMARNDLLAADPYDTAVALEAVQTQLETHYTLTARMARLSLAEYLR